MASIDYSTSIQTIDGEETTLEPYRGDVLLIVNTASACGFTPQFEGLEALYQKYREQGFVVLGFPCNQFGGQEPGTEDEIAGFCRSRYQVTFPMHAKVDVKGPEAHSLFRQLTSGAPGILGSKAIKWNFTKFLVGRDGTILGRFATTTEPRALSSAIEAAL